jgi:hypothetical protein
VAISFRHLAFLFRHVANSFRHLAFCFCLLAILFRHAAFLFCHLTFFLRHAAIFLSHAANFICHPGIKIQAPEFPIARAEFFMSACRSESINHTVQTAEHFFGSLKKPCAMEKHF